MTQTEHSRANRAAWSHRAYEAWQHGYGSPPEAAASIREDPEIILREYREHLGDVRGKVVANLLGSHGRRAVALAILGAEVTVVDISAENQRYALELARAAGVTIEYIVSDILEWKTESLADHFDTVLMEYGILHYFVQLDPLVRLLEKILKPAGKVVLHEFHPIDKKCGLIEEGGRLILQDVRIVLVSAGFSRELTTAVLWLNEKGLDIRCVRIQPYDYDGRTLVDVQQVIPLPETVDYQVQIREKKRREQTARKSGPDFTRYDVTTCGKSRAKLTISRLDEIFYAGFLSVKGCKVDILTMFGAQFALMVQDRSLKRGEAPVWGVVSSDTNLHPRPALLFV